MGEEVRGQNWREKERSRLNLVGKGVRGHRLNLAGKRRDWMLNLEQEVTKWVKIGGKGVGLKMAGNDQEVS